MAQILIKNGRVWTGEKFLYSDVLIDAAVISRIEPNIQCENAYVYDAAGKTVSPGLIDAHIHLRGISADVFGTPAESSCFPFGVTAALDVSAIQGDGRLSDSLAVKNRVLALVSIQDDAACFTTAEKAFSQYGSRVIGIKVCLSLPQARTAEPLRQACGYARSKGLPLMVHCTGTPIPMAQIVDCLEQGDILTHPFHGGSHTALEDQYQCLRAAREKGIWLDAGFAGHIHTDLAVLKGAVAAGIGPDTISTDITRKSAYTRGGRYGMTLCMNMARAAGMSEEAVFRAVTSAPAEMLGKADQWGALQVGRCADVAVFQTTDEGFRLTDAAGNHLQSETGCRCVLTIADGDIVYRHT